MNFQPSDYLSGLNLNFDANLPVEDGSSVDLDLFTSSDFFDLDVFDNGTTVPFKEGQLKRLQSIKEELKEQSPISMTPLAETPESLPLMELDVYKQLEMNEIKRKRNTAASARFRVKKKLKEKEMMEHTRGLQDKLAALEKKVKLLEMENKCLKQMVFDNNEKRNQDLLESIKKRSLGQHADHERRDGAFAFSS